MKSKKNLRKHNKCWKDFQKYWGRQLRKTNIFYKTQYPRVSGTTFSSKKNQNWHSMLPILSQMTTSPNFYNPCVSFDFTKFYWLRTVKKNPLQSAARKAKHLRKPLLIFFFFRIFSLPYPEEREVHMHTHITQQPSTESEASEVCPASHRTTAKIPAWSSSHRWAATDDSQTAKTGKPRPWDIKHLQFS